EGEGGRIVAIGRRLDRKRLRQKPDSNQRLDLRLLVGIKNPVEDLPIINGTPRRVFRVSVGRSPLERRGAVAGAEEIVRPDVDRLRAERRKLVQQFLAVFHVGVVGLVVSEVSPRRLEGTLGRSAVNKNGHLSAQRKRKQERRSTQITRHGLIVAQAAGKLKTSVSDVREVCGAAPTGPEPAPWPALVQT